MFGFSVILRRPIIGLVLAAILILAVTFTVTAQNPDNGGEPARTGNEPGLAPDKVTVVEEVELLPSPAAPAAPSALYFKFLTPNVFVPYDDNMTYTYYGGGCVYRTAGTSFADYALQLPEGSEIDFLRIYFYDNDADDNVSAWLWSFDGAGVSTLVTTVSSTGTPGQSSAGSGFFSHFVDNTNEALTLRVDYQAGADSTLRICGVRIRYQFYLPTTYLPVIFNGANP